MEVASDSGDVMENLYPALAQCFAIILCGYARQVLCVLLTSDGDNLSQVLGRSFESNIGDRSERYQYLRRHLLLAVVNFHVSGRIGSDVR